MHGRLVDHFQPKAPVRVLRDVPCYDCNGRRFEGIVRENSDGTYNIIDKRTVTEEELIWLKEGEMRGRVFDVWHKWKTIESFQPPLGVPCYIHWNGWESRVQDLLERDWIITKVTNRYTGKVKLYVRDPVTKLMGAGELMERKNEAGLAHSYSVELNYFSHERNQRIKKFIQTVESEEIVRITEDNIGVVLEHIAELQRKSAKPKKRKKVSEVEILQYRVSA